MYYVNEAMALPACESSLFNLNNYYLVMSWVAALIWASIYFVILDFSNNGPDFSCRGVTLIHAMLATVGGAYDLIVLKEHIKGFVLCRPYNSDFENAMISISLGYFMFDLCWCLIYSFESVPMVFHHIAALSLLIVTTYFQNSGAEVLLGVMASEFTSIFLNLRWMIKFYGYYKGSVLGLIVDFVFVLLFILVRVIFAGWYTYSILDNPMCRTFLRIGFILFYIVNCLFFVEVVTFARYRYKKFRIRGV